MAKRFAFTFFARLFHTIVERKRRKNDGKSGNVLLIKCDGIGDFVLFLNAAKALRARFQDKKLTLVCGENALFLAKKSGCFDEIILFRQDDFLYTKKFIRFYREIKDRKFDLLLSPGQPRSVGEDLFAMLVNAKEKIASLGEAGALEADLKKKLDGIYDRLIDTGNENMTLVQTAVFLREIGMPDYRATRPKIEFDINFYLYTPPEYFIVFVGGSNKNKKRNAADYRVIADEISRKTGWVCLLCGDERDADEEEEFKKAGDLPYFSFVGKTNQEELMGIISRAKFLLGNDTCAVHFASALNVPSVCVKGVDSGTKFFPYIVEKREEGEILPVPVCVKKEAFPCYWCTLKPAREHYDCIGGYFGNRPTECLRALRREEILSAVEKVVAAINQREDFKNG